MKEKIDAVKKFHHKFKLGYESLPKAAIGKEKIELRFALMKEENNEYLEAAQNNDLVEVADALGDMLYVLCGTILEHGMQDKIDEVFEEIHRSNMSKLGKDGQPLYDKSGKVQKGANYFHPNLEKFFK